MEEHIKHVDDVLTGLGRAGISLKFKKSSFFHDTIKYLGHIIKSGRLEIDAVMTKALRESKPPTNVTQLRSFLGAASEYKKLIRDFARIADPLYEVLKDVEPANTRKGSKHPVQLNDKSRATFDEIVKLMTNPPVLPLPVAGGQYTIDTDASPGQLGAALFQMNEVGVRRPIGFWSRQMSAPERNYSATDEKCLALVWGIKTLRPYLLGEYFEAYTDPYAVNYLMTNTERSGRLIRWRLALAEYDFTPRYNEGCANQVADMMSRIPPADPQDETKKTTQTYHASQLQRTSYTRKPESGCSPCPRH